MDLLQLAVVIVILFDLVYLRMTNFEGTGSVLSYFDFTCYYIGNFLSSRLLEGKDDESECFYPNTVLYVPVSILEAVPALRLDNETSSLFMLAPLLVCNAWQILILHKVLDNKKS